MHVKDMVGNDFTVGDIVIPASQPGRKHLVEKITTKFIGYDRIKVRTTVTLRGESQGSRFTYAVGGYRPGRVIKVPNPT